ncbi:BolA protein [Polynucleobacter meluiroseus]|uniref:BolA protein n=1 Tax=Polynucleobacter meluiroseus TaxID=1938814 RepID=A0A240DZE0_9BURK|nr:BolA family protein [Polynucleobacter meluiroseus]SNX28558.1 BolA protein [Polynucleobacter meluiroseus]
MSLNQDRIRLFEADLQRVFEITEMLFEDESHLHAGHAGAASGGGHFKLTLISPEFQGLNTVARHRAIYAALSSHFPDAIHALSIQALTPNERPSSV